MVIVKITAWEDTQIIGKIVDLPLPENVTHVTLEVKNGNVQMSELTTKVTDIARQA